MSMRQDYTEFALNRDKYCLVLQFNSNNELNISEKWSSGVQMLLCNKVAFNLPLCYPLSG